MDEQKQKLIDKAIKQYKVVRPCGNKTNLDECFTRNKDLNIFWFNTEDNSTRILFDSSNPPVQE